MEQGQKYRYFNMLTLRIGPFGNFDQKNVFSISEFFFGSSIKSGGRFCRFWPTLNKILKKFKFNFDLRSSASTSYVFSLSSD